MLSRRYLRVKVLQILYAYNKSEEKSLGKHEKELFHSINKSYDLYFQFFQILAEIQRLEELQIEYGKNKNLPTSEELNPSANIVNNRLINSILGNEMIHNNIQQKGSLWAQYPEFLKKLYKSIRSKKYYEKYSSIEEPSIEDDLYILTKILNEELRVNEELYNILEEQSVYWNDEIDFTFSMVLKALKMATENSASLKVLPMFKDEDDKEFVKKLFRKTCTNHSEYLEVIDKYTKNWELERIAFMDILIMQMAIAEFVEFQSIPTKVTLNEYIEISKFYSTKKSNSFINGVLDKVFHYYIQEKIVQKSGRGLVGDLKKNKD